MWKPCLGCHRYSSLGLGIDFTGTRFCLAFELRTQPLGHKLSRAEDVGAVLELKRQLRKAELGDGAQFHDAGQSGGRIVFGR